MKNDLDLVDRYDLIGETPAKYAAVSFVIIFLPELNPVFSISTEYRVSHLFFVVDVCLVAGTRT